MSLSWSMILLAIWMVMYAIFTLTNITVVYAMPIHGVVALSIAICLLLKK